MQSVVTVKPGNAPNHSSDSGTLRVWLIPALCALLAIVTAALYSPVARHPFVDYDDSVYVSENAHVQSGLSVETVRWALTTSAASNWHPLTWLSHALDCQFFGLNAGAHHLTSVAIHICNVLLLFLLLSRVTRAVGRSVMVAALFALHPLNVESVAWIAERKNVLCTFFFFLALAAYGWYLLRPSWKRYLAIGVFFAMGLASKPMVITLPFVLLLLDYWPLCRFQGSGPPSRVFPLEQKPWAGLVWEKLPLLVLSAASAAITVAVQNAGHAIEPLGDLPLLSRLQNAVYSYAMYLAKTFWPVNLAAFYPHPLNSLTLAQVALSLVILLVATVLVWKYRATRGYAFVGWLWFLGTLVPVIGVLQVGAQGMADRYAYLPIIGLLVGVVWGLADFVQAKALDSRVATAIAITVPVALSAVTYRQIAYWRSSQELWTHALQVTRNNFIANDNMGFLLLDQGRPEAMNYFYAAAAIWPRDFVSRGEIAASLQDQGKLQEAIQEYQNALQDGPDPASAAHYYGNMGVIFREVGNDQLAKQSFRAALDTDEPAVQALIQQLSQWVASQPAAANYWRLGLLLEGANRPAEAKSAYQRAIEIDPHFVAASKALQVLEAPQR